MGDAKTFPAYLALQAYDESHIARAARFGAWCAGPQGWLALLLAGVAICLGGCNWFEEPNRRVVARPVTPELFGAPVADTWNNIEEVVAAAPSQKLVPQTFRWDHEDFVIDVPPHSVVRSNDNDPVIAVSLPNGTEIEILPGYYEMEEIRTEMEETYWDITEWPYLDDHLIIAQREQENQPVRLTTFMNLPIATRQFCMRLELTDAPDARPGLERILQGLKVGYSLRVQEPFPEDLLALAQRLRMELLPADAIVADEVIGIKFGPYATGDQIALVPEFENVEMVEFGLAYLQPIDLDWLTGCPRLLTLVATGDDWVDSSQWDSISQCPTLTSLSVPSSSEPYALRYLSDLHGLSKLDLGIVNEYDCNELTVLHKLLKLRHLSLHTAFPGSELGFLAGLTKLESLQLENLDISTLDLTSLASLTNLRKVDLHGRRRVPKDAAFSGQELVALSDATNLEELSLRNMPLSHAGVARIAKLKSLRVLRLNRTSIDDDDLVTLAGMENLQELSIGGNREITEEGKQRLRAAAPHLRVR